MNVCVRARLTEKVCVRVRVSGDLAVCVSLFMCGNLSE